mmetsp:Transcript_14134/g.19469  ORF Transcript_14134/g.19469 Transcript_14134/m.19469 type:complete len:448 (-) Transcript_14134:239-1582(-)
MFSARNPAMLQGHGLSVHMNTRGNNTRYNTVCEASGHKTGVKRNANLGKLQAGYLFPEIARRRNAHLAENPDAKIISLGIGDTTEPIPEIIVKGLEDAARALGTQGGYSGYGAEQGQGALREAVLKTFYSNCPQLSAEDIFVSDGSKCDISRLQSMFGPTVSVAVQDPAYPAYVDTSVMTGQTGLYNSETQQFDNISYLKCCPENDFFPDLESAPATDVVFFCSPNNPTGATATRAQLEELVAWAKKNGSIIVYDAAYAIFITDPDCPKSIFEIPGAEEVALETASFSKFAGFTGVRLGWTVVPEALKYSEGFSVRQDWNRVMTTCFNGASNVAQGGGLACCTPEGQEAMMNLVKYYKTNAALLKDCFDSLGFTTYGGTNAPYVWVSFAGKPSWETFQDILSKTNVVTTPGAGFGVAGEGFIRISAFGHRENVEEAIRRFKEAFGSK